MQSLLDKQIKSIKKYTGIYYAQFNKSLRENAVPPNTEDFIVYVNLWNFLNKNRIIEPTTVYRGIRISDDNKQTFDESLERLNTSYTSTSLLKDMANDFKWGKCCVLNINLPAGARAFDVTKYSEYNEQEVLLAPGFIRATGDPVDGVYECEYTNFDRNFIIDNIYPQTIQEENCQDCMTKGIIRRSIIFSDGENYCKDCFDNYCIQVNYNFMYSYDKENVRNETTENPSFSFRSSKLNTIRTGTNRKNRKSLKKTTRKSTSKTTRKSLNKTTRKSTSKTTRKSRSKKNRKSLSKTTRKY